MIPLRAAEVAAACAEETAIEATVTGLVVDSRLVEPGDLFVALHGERTDGTRFLAEARAAGAALALIARDSSVTVPGTVTEGFAIGVADPLIALGEVAAEVRRRSGAMVVAVTGSTGKTSTKDLLAALLSRVAPTVASLANQNTEIGLPLTFDRVEPETRAVVCELGMRGPGQIGYLAELCRPDVAVITGVGPVHLELLGTVEAVAAAKAEILDSLTSRGTAVVPHAEPLLAPYVEQTRARVITFGETAGADVCLVAFTGGRADFEVHGRTLQVPVTFTQHHNALNLAAALAACEGLGLPLEEVAAGAAEVTFSRWRGELIELERGGLLIADCYNANPTSMAAALRHLAAVAGSRRSVAVLGDMAELGPGGPAYHRQVGELARELGIDRVVSVGDLARDYGGIAYPDVATLLGDLDGLLQPGDAVLVKASRSVGLEAVVEAVAP